MKGFLPRTLHPGLQLLLLVGLMLLGACVASFFVVSYAWLGLEVPVGQLGDILARPADFPQGWTLAMVSQGLLLFGAFAGGALVLAWVLGYRWREYFAPRPLGAAWWPLAAAALVLAILPLMSVLISWNADAHFPAWLHGFEEWARAKEDQAQVLTKYLTRFTSLGRLGLGLVVIALVPAVAEELVFRGVVQRNLVQWLDSRHLGVWLAAAIFSAIHLQFFGFVPRFVLGLVLGYLFEWSGNILVPMAAHFTQNALQLLLLYLVQHGHLGWGFDPDSTDALPWPLVAASVVATSGLLWLLHRHLPAGPGPAKVISSRGVSVQ